MNTPEKPLDPSDFNEVIKRIVRVAPRPQVISFFSDLQMLVIQKKVPLTLNWITLIHTIQNLDKLDDALLSKKEKSAIRSSLAKKIHENQDNAVDMYSAAHFRNLLEGIKRGFLKIFFEQEATPLLNFMKVQLNELEERNGRLNKVVMYLKTKVDRYEGKKGPYLPVVRDSIKQALKICKTNQEVETNFSYMEKIIEGISTIENKLDMSEIEDSINQIDVIYGVKAEQNGTEEVEFTPPKDVLRQENEFLKQLVADLSARIDAIDNEGGSEEERFIKFKKTINECNITIQNVKDAVEIQNDKIAAEKRETFLKQIASRRGFIKKAIESIEKAGEAHVKSLQALEKNEGFINTVLRTKFTKVDKLLKDLTQQINKSVADNCQFFTVELDRLNKELADKEREYYYFPNIDLPNKRKYYVYVEETARKCIDNETPLFVMMVTIVNPEKALKVKNASPKEEMIRLAAWLKETVMEWCINPNFCTIYKEYTFAVVLEEEEQKKAIDVFTHIKESIKKKKKDIVLSAGLAQLLPDQKNLDTIGVKLAQQALEAAEEARLKGLNLIRVYAEDVANQ